MQNEIVHVDPPERDDEVENAKNAWLIFWFMVGSFGGAIAITIFEKLWTK